MNYQITIKRIEKNKSEDKDVDKELLFKDVSKKDRKEFLSLLRSEIRTVVKY